MIDLTNDSVMIANEFGGSEKKCTVIYNKRVYMLKFPDPVREKGNDLSYMNNATSEDIGCKIFKTLGFETQNTFLAKYNFNGKEKIVVACEDFCQDGGKLIEFSKLLLSDVDSPHIGRRFVPIELVNQTIEKIQYDKNKEIFKEQFWKMFVADTLIGNSDRHTDNWGFLKQDGEIKFAPIYDCGSSLSPLFSDIALKELLNGDEYKFKLEEYNLPSPYSYQGQKIFYPNFYKNPPLELQKALKEIVPKIDMEKIKNIIENTEAVSDIRKEYLFKAVSYRYDNILYPALKRIMKQEKLQQQQEEQKSQNGILDRFGSDKVEADSVQEDIEKQKDYEARLEAIKNIDLNAKPKTNAEKLQQFCKKSMEAHGEDYKDYVADGVKSFLLSTPSAKLEGMTKLIDYVAPVVAFDSEEYRYSEFVKDTIRQDKQFRKQLANRDKTPEEVLGR